MSDEPAGAVQTDMTAYYGALSSRAWAARVARDAAFYQARLQRTMDGIAEEIADLQTQLQELHDDWHTLEAHRHAWATFAAHPGAVPATARGGRYYALWTALPDYITEDAPGEETG
jgi:hypothetical protein